MRHKDLTINNFGRPLSARIEVSVTMNMPLHTHTRALQLLCGARIKYRGYFYGGVRQVMLMMIMLMSWMMIPISPY